MSKSKRDLSPEEGALWRRVAATVKARSTGAPLAAAPGKPAGPPVVQQSRRPGVLGTTTAIQAPANRGAEKRVRRGKLELGGALDLHGHTQASGRAALGRFIGAAFVRGERAVVVVTGVGRGGEGVLRQRLPEWLAEPDLRPLVSGFAPAHRSHGGAGAFYVFLKRNRRVELE